MIIHNKKTNQYVAGMQVLPGKKLSILWTDDPHKAEHMTEVDGSFTLIDEKTRLQLEHVETGEEEEEESDEETREFWDEE